MAFPAVRAKPSETVGTRQRIRLVFGGVVQGVGFRPFVHSLARRVGVVGFAYNDLHGLIVEVEGDSRAVDRFAGTAMSSPPPLAVVERVDVATIPLRGDRTFEILASATAGEHHASIAPDVGTCADCLQEIFEPGNRRFAYPFTNCTNCGPRFTIIRGIPYDRAFTTMGDFVMCDDCAREYADPVDRRFHAQPVCCPACGPHLSFVDRHHHKQPGEPIAAAVQHLRDGAIVAIKGLGGYHLAVLASDEDAVARLRARKHREDKPFAVMVADVDEARRLAHIDDTDERLLTDERRPIVLLERREGARIAAATAPHNRSIGLMLPYTPLHHLLVAQLGEPLVLTSGNVSDEPIAYRDTDACERLGKIADFFLTHDRAIHMRTDDSVVRAFRGRALTIRRARGYAPQPLLLPAPARRPILACGAELKSTFCLAKDNHAFLSHHIGDLESFQALSSFTEGIAHYRKLFDIDPAIVAYDLHPDYVSTRYAAERAGVETEGVQHHHAHIAACMAENGESEAVIGVAFDGLGYGTDRTLWGGEFLVADLCGFERVAHLDPVPMPGGTIAIKQPWRMAAVYLDAAYGDDVPQDLAVLQRNRDRWEVILQLARSGNRSPQTSSVGRLFDAVAAIIGQRDSINYEGQAAVELEQLADPTEDGSYDVRCIDGASPRLRGADLVTATVNDLRRGIDAAVVAARFHNSLARVVADTCAAIAGRRGLSTVALSGGVFQNMFLLRRSVALLEQRGLRVLTHTLVPSNDGGISFGQAVIAAARDQRGIADQRSSFRKEGEVSWAHS